MFSQNPFPESREKNYLRKLHFIYLNKYKQFIGRDLVYFGLPSAEMLDVVLWKSVLSRIIAIERDSEIALVMYRKSQQVGIRNRTVIIEGNLSEVMGLMALENNYAELHLNKLSIPERNNINFAKEKPFDVVNLDLCGGFLYPKQTGSSENSDLLKYLIDFQSRRRHPFLLLLTFSLRDTGWEQYDNFIGESLKALENQNIKTDQMKVYYNPETTVPDQPQNLRRLRFCLPIYLHKLAFDYYQVRIVGSWYYKTFYHAALFFEPRVGISTLGTPWPPIDEIKDLLGSKLFRIDDNGDESVTSVELSAPDIE
ncbi:MAG: hypothetical protein P4N59_24820 [Negativicutes bacterium]|nr:hypothetical protein [Negativicutes bacterium]